MLVEEHAFERVPFGDGGEGSKVPVRIGMRARGEGGLDAAVGAVDRVGVDSWRRRVRREGFVLAADHRGVVPGGGDRVGRGQAGDVVRASSVVERWGGEFLA